jgi:sulfur carrier protein
MKIELNGSALEIATDLTLKQLLELHGFHNQRIAVEVNLSIISKSQHQNHVLCEGDKIEVVHALGGG